MSQILQQLMDELAAGRLRIVDLTQPLGPDTPVIDLPPMFAASPPCRVDVISRYDERGPAWYWNTLHLGEHTGTHFDAPIHWVTGRDLADNACDTIAARRFVGPAAVIDVRREAERDADYLLTVADLERWEAVHGRIARGSWVLLHTGWSTRTGSAFVNAGSDGPHSPGFHPDTSRLLAQDRDILGVGVETIGTDAGQAGRFDPPFPNHHLMHGAGRFGLASLCNLDQLPPTGAIVVAAPLKIVRGSGSPVRAFAIAPA
jgi:kynurenine formamidase